ncbi:hypothetical protein [Tumebacillus flagellatus]|uniref:Uncharacterized protein n=1 Tax=Tumebacillus flagellatus TaxID=1157490 RepID=A0A074LRB0_9BACL|nr:hypothetical protein [Tumebacillus flagellatus]KEO82378.1 hypothetical protein EL26_15755 [Tumebacillus flagellatus]
MSTPATTPNPPDYDKLMEQLLETYAPENFRKQLAIEFQGPLPTLPEELASFYKEIGPNEWRFEVNGRAFYLPALHRLDDLDQPYRDALVFMVIGERAHWVLYHTSGVLYRHDVKLKRLVRISEKFADFVEDFVRGVTADVQAAEEWLTSYGL